MSLATRVRVAQIGRDNSERVGSRVGVVMEGMVMTEDGD